MAHLVKQANGNLIIRNDWHQSDINDVAERMDLMLCDEEVRRIMELVIARFDANYGINLDAIESAISAVTGSRNDE